MNAVSTSAVGRGGDIRDAVREAASRAPIVEVAVGARALGGDPFDDVCSTLQSTGARLIGHHTLPLVEGAAVRPTLENITPVLQLVDRYEMASYTCHPFKLAECSEDELLAWTLQMHDSLGDRGVGFAIETMFTPRDARDRAAGAWHLADEASVVRFAIRCREHGMRAPLLVDLAHLYIETMHGNWRWETFEELVKDGYVAQLHVSQNDGRRDAHEALDAVHPVAEILRRIEPIFDGLIIDEGRS